MIYNCTKGIQQVFKIRDWSIVAWNSELRTVKSEFILLLSFGNLVILWMHINTQNQKLNLQRVLGYNL